MMAQQNKEEPIETSSDFMVYYYFFNIRQDQFVLNQRKASRKRKFVPMILSKQDVIKNVLHKRVNFVNQLSN